jgi:signal transduction histidine kinase
VRIRTFALVLLVLLGAVPLGAYSIASIRRSERTAVTEVKTSNQRLAKVVAERIGAHVDAQQELLSVVGAAALSATDATEAQLVLEAHQLRQQHFHDLAVFGADGSLFAGTGSWIEYRDLIQEAVRGNARRSPLIKADDPSQPLFGHVQVFVEPVFVAGKQVGVVASRVDLITMWRPVEAVHVGERGRARLVDFNGTLLAHGEGEERRKVFASNAGAESRIIAGALLGGLVENHSGTQVVASVAAVPGSDWLVIVEQPATEAYAAARAMKWDLLWLGGGAILLVLVVGVLAGRTLVRGLERLRAHTKVLARGELGTRIDTKAAILEVEALATSLNDMAASIQEAHEKAKARERLATFARVAAGLAHDIRQPIETIRAACATMQDDPNDVEARELFEFMTEKELPRLKRYMDDLQRIAHEGNVELVPTEIVPRELTDELAADLRSSPKWGGVEFAARGGARPFVADRDLVRRALYNLCANAADACAGKGADGNVRIEVADTDAAGWVEFRIADNGPGIAAERLAKLLEGDFSSTKRSTGVGLGFGVALHVAEAHGGKITAVSEVGVGSTFVVRLPPLPRQDSAPNDDVTSDDGMEPVVGPRSHATH